MPGSPPIRGQFGMDDFPEQSDPDWCDWVDFTDPVDIGESLGYVRVHLVIREDQPIIPRSGWTVGEGTCLQGYTPDLPVDRRYTEFDREVHSARLILIELARILDPET